MTTHSKRNYTQEQLDKMKPKDTSKHPWRRRNDQLRDYSMKSLDKLKKKNAL